MARSRMRSAAFAITFLFAAPAHAAPNVFWIFGFEPPYGSGAGGLADTGTDGHHAGLARGEATTPPVPVEAAPRLLYAALDDLLAFSPRRPGAKL